MSKIKTGNRSKAEDAAVLAEMVNPVNLAHGQSVLVEDGATYIVQTVQGMTTRTRIA